MTEGHNRVAASRSLVVRTSSPEETEALGRALGAHLRPGDVVALSGELGAGKTVFTRGIAAGAGAGGHVASPTFTLIREYRGRTATVIHADLYRLDTPRQLQDIGLEEVLEGGPITVIEWAEKARALLPEEYLWVEIRFTEDDSTRELAFIPHGRRAAGLVRHLTRGASRPGDGEPG